MGHKIKLLIGGKPLSELQERIQPLSKPIVLHSERQKY